MASTPVISIFNVSFVYKLPTSFFNISAVGKPMTSSCVYAKKFEIEASIFLPPTLRVAPFKMVDIFITAMSVAVPPMSTTMFTFELSTFLPSPMQEHKTDGTSTT